MKRTEVKCPAKINLSLDVIRKREDGYHELRMLMQTIGLYDTVSIEASSSSTLSIEILSDSLAVPCDDTNTCYKAAELFYNKLGAKRRVRIFIQKNIPQGAGMAGGSADAAGVLRGLNSLEENPFDNDILMKLGKKVGADVPFCINGGCCLCEGIGERLTFVKPLRNAFLVVAKPNFSISTVWAYKNLRLTEESVHPDTDKLIKALKNGNIAEFKYFSGNTLEAVAAEAHKEIYEYKKIMYAFGAAFSMMTGSGAAVYGIFEGENEAEKAKKYFENITDEVYKIYLD